jgi:DNA helicase-2/ATP-dependent DNA helicase PcrA
MKPSQLQKEILNWSLNQLGHAIIEARAGCGKTSTIMLLVHYLVKQNAKVEIIIGAFNKKIQEEIAKKLETMKIDWKNCTAVTMHSMGFNLWRKTAKNVQVDEKKVSKIIDGYFEETMDILWKECGEIIRQLVSLGKQSAIGAVCELDDMNRWNEIIEKHGVFDELPETFSEEVVTRAAIKVLKKSYAMDYDFVDFDDMVVAPVVHKVKPKYQKDFVFVDEAQDTNDARRELAFLFLKPGTGRFIAVGDPKQAIYGFTGADADSLNIIKDRLKATTLPLNVTYRCPKAVVAEAQAYVPDIVAHETAPEGKVTRTHYNEVIKDLKAFTTKDVILCRNMAPLIDLAYTFITNKIAVRVEGKDIGRGLINLINRWKSAKTLDALLKKLDKHVDDQTKKFTAKKQPEMLEKILDKVECVRTMVNMLLLEKKTSVDDLRDLINTMFTDSDSDKPAELLTLSTVHKSKGREWKKVYLLGANRYMPSRYAKKDWQIEQESNLSYVAITRAQEELIYVDVDLPAPKKNREY